MKELIVLFLLATALCEAKAWMNINATPRERATALLGQMNQDEKIHMVHGTGRPDKPYAGNVPVNTRLGIPSINMLDGPQGVGDKNTLVTAWPSALTVASSWDTQAMETWASAMAVEQREKGTNVLLGPCVNIARVPMGGRTFEGFGEDPILAASLAKTYVKGVQDEGLIANVKHFVDNSQEFDRYNVSENVPDRAQYEIYYPAFKAAVEANVGSVMCSYNKVNNDWACENDHTLNVGLKTYMGFNDGFVVSDWDATHSTVKAANAGLDMQMPGYEYFGDALKNAIASGDVAQSRLDDMVLRILTPMFSVGLFDRPQTGNLTANVTSAAHAKLAEDLAVKSTVLLKNDGPILPLTTLNIAIFGPNAFVDPVVIGGGSGTVIPPYIRTPLEAIRKRAGPTANVTYVESDVAQAKIAAAAADVAIVFASAWSAENIDRTSLSVDGGMDAIIEAVALVQPNTVVVLNTVGAVVMPWIDSVKSVVEAWMSGQEAGTAIARILFGDDNPSGKLPLTFPKSMAEIPVNTTEQYPGVGYVNRQVTYSEGLNVGYRWYNSFNIEPLFPFGHGLSYTTFTYSNLILNGRVTTFDVTNSGSVDGEEVVQLYLTFPNGVDEPPTQLKRFKKVFIAAGDVKQVSLEFDLSDCYVWNNGWIVEYGRYNIGIGSSSRDLRLTGIYTLIPTSPPQPTPTPAPTEPGSIGTGYVILIITLVASVLCCGGGMVYKSAKGYQGLERVPGITVLRKCGLVRRKPDTLDLTAAYEEVTDV